MPELPEVETITNAISKAIIGQSFLQINAFSPKLRYNLTLQNQPLLLNQEIIKIYRRARYTVIELKNRYAIILHYGMTGSVRICAPETKRRKHEHVCFELSNGKSLRFEDPRRFGHISYSKLCEAHAIPNELSLLGVEPLSEVFTGKYLSNKLKGRKVPIKTAIMENKVVVGVGNIYANESLFSSKINPQTKANEISLKKLNLLVQNIKIILKQAIAAGGTTIADFKGLNGQEGKFDINLKVYGRTKEPCLICKTPIQKIKQSGRSSFYCPKCQK